MSLYVQRGREVDASASWLAAAALAGRTLPGSCLLQPKCAPIGPGCGWRCSSRGPSRARSEGRKDRDGGAIGADGGPVLRSGGQPKKSRVGDEALGRRGRLSTQGHVMADAQGRPMPVVLRAGQPHDCRRTGALLPAVHKTGNALADQAYDANQVLAAGAALGAETVVPRSPRRRVARPVDPLCCRQRNRIERLMGRRKPFRRAATRYDKTASNYLGFVHFVCTMRWLR